MSATYRVRMFDFYKLWEGVIDITIIVYAVIVGQLTVHQEIDLWLGSISTFMGIVLCLVAIYYKYLKIKEKRTKKK